MGKLTQGSQGTSGDILRSLVPDQVVEHYSDLLERGAVPVDEYTAGREEEAVQELVDRGLAYRQTHAGEPELRAVEPVIALECALLHLQDDLAHQHQALLDGHHRLRDLQQNSLSDTGSHGGNRVLRVLAEDDEILDSAIGLGNTAVRDSMVTVNDATGVIMSSVRHPEVEAARRQVRSRIIFDARLVDRAEPVPIASTQPDGEARALARVPIELKLVDETAAMVPLVTSEHKSFLLVRSQPLARALRHYFELLWQWARPIPPGDSQIGPLSQAQRDVLLLMSYGHKDQGIARRTGMSTRTVRRHIATVMELLSADTRFAAGVEAERRGWI
ncbi:MULTISPECIES: helix-turn-helix transcriptional regulator [Micromonospora]|uniref:helix-turn-helix transcriptional regulator n=1 Tax=Micromonospora TaxID=1873 RepID=UPI001EE91E29|nr:MULTISPECIES: LuxR C-terminal-related transcriptional regulator [Micromonospora]MCG5452528.1 LuxR C-terminal-related transcriptional regulator [Micromonospora hortensis]MCX5118160.1 LuxR C-terminal-related transcriptional regulator [Micromonospora sp. NBC_00362]